jgi:hypothetical protein
MNHPMKRAIISAAIVLAVLCGARPAQAASIPFINVGAFGIELCPQSLCDAAIFVGFLHGQVGFNPNALGTFAVAVTHESPLPTIKDDTVALLRGVFEFRFGLRRIRGVVLPGGVLKSNGDNTFDVDAQLATIEGDLLDARIVLDHTVFPPTVRGSVTSQSQ